MVFLNQLKEVKLTQKFLAVLPIWFQAVKGASAVKSGIMSLPMVLTLVLVSIISGIGVTLVGYCKFHCPVSPRPRTDDMQTHL